MFCKVAEFEDSIVLLDSDKYINECLWKPHDKLLFHIHSINQQTRGAAVNNDYFIYGIKILILTGWVDGRWGRGAGGAEESSQEQGLLLLLLLFLIVLPPVPMTFRQLY